MDVGMKPDEHDLKISTGVLPRVPFKTPQNINLFGFKHEPISNMERSITATNICNKLLNICLTKLIHYANEGINFDFNQ